MTTKQIKSLRLRLLRVFFCHADCRSLVLVTDDFFAALVEVNVEKYHLLDAWHVEYSLQVKIYLVTPVHELFHRKLTRF